MDQSGNNPNLDPAVIQSILSLQDNDTDPQAIQLQRKQKVIDMLRQQSMKSPEGFMAGRRYVAPSSLSILSQGLQGAMVRQQQPEVDQGVADLSMKRTNAKGKYFDALQRAMRRQNPPGTGSNVGGNAFADQPAGMNPHLGDDIGLGYD